MKYIARTEYPELWKIAKQIGYTGHDLRADTFTGPMKLHSYWSGGSRDNYRLINLDNHQTLAVPENGSGFDKGTIELKELPPNYCLVRWHRRCADCTIYFRADQLVPTLEMPSAELTEDETIVLVYTRSLKSSYCGISNYRYYQAADDGIITEPRWNAAKQSLINKGLLNKAGAITTKGRNVCPNKQHWQLAYEIKDKNKPRFTEQEKKTLSACNDALSNFFLGSMK